MTRFLSIFAVLLSSVALASGYTNAVENGASQTVDSDWNETAITVGGSSSNNALMLVSGARVTNDTTQVGGSAIADGNAVNVGSGASWNMTGDLTVGDMGSANSFEITAGGSVSNNASFVGVDAQASNNTVNVTGSGARWDNAGAITIGGVSNAVSVSSGGTVAANDLIFSTPGVSKFHLQEGGTLNITGAYNADTQTDVNWESGAALEVNGQLTMDGGLAEEGRILTLGGSNATWSIDGSIAVGTNGTVTIEDGATVVNSAGGSVDGSGNTVLVQGTGSEWQNNGALTLSNDNSTVTVQTGGKISADYLNIADGSVLNLINTGTLELSTNYFNVAATSNLNWSTGTLSIEGTLEGMDTTEITANGSSSTAAVLANGRDLTLNGGEWQNGTNDLIVGFGAGGSALSVTNGGQAVNANGYIGHGTSSAGNSVTVSDAGSLWWNKGGNLYLGAYLDGTNLTQTGSGNLLNVNDGAQVFVGEITNNTPGMLVASTNGAQFTIWNGSAFIDDTLQLGFSTNAAGSVTIKSGGYLSVGNLVITNANSALDLQSGGVFDIRSDFDVATREANGFNWSSNSTLSVGGALTGKTSDLDKGQDLVLDGSNAVWDITGEDLEIGLAGSSVLTLINGATLINANTTIGANTNSGAHGVVLNSGAFWLADGDLTIGGNTSTNYLQLFGGSTNQLTGSATIGGTNTSGNYVQVDGSNTLWAVGGDLTVSTDNSIELDSDGLISVGGDLLLQSNAVVSGEGTIQFADANTALYLMNGNGNLSSSVVFEGAGNNTVDVDGGIFYVVGSNSNQYRNFETLSLTDTILYGYGTNDAFGIVDMTGGTIAPSDVIGVDGTGTLMIDGAFTSSNTTYFAQVNGDQGSDLLHFTGAVDLTGLVAQVVVLQVNTNETTILTSDTGLNNNFMSNSIVNNLLLYDADLVVGANDVNVVITTNNTQFSSSLDYAATESVRSGFSAMKDAVFTRTKQLRRNLVSTAHSIPHEAFLMSNTNAPAGPQGPGQDNTIFDMHVWMQFFNGQGTYDPQGNSYGFDLNNSGTSIGADRLIGDNMIVGFNYTYVRADARTTNQDTMDNETYWLGAYGEWISQNGLYVDTMLAYGRSNYDTVRVEQDSVRDYQGTASYRGSELGAYADVGQYFYYKNLALSPYIGLQLLTLKTDDHTEQNTNGRSEINVEGQSRNLVESTLGMKGRYRFDTNLGRFQTTGYAEWMHDFVQDDVTTTLSADNLPPVSMAAIEPDADLLNVGLGLSWICRDYMEIGIGYNGRFSDGYEEHTGSLLIDIMF
ncbi:autotransporter domain-containing protein [Pontiellaceae bacterium B1224]|nr:autotransporter domain-containing protein [Pontiellaceae bacterium B1224]